MEIQFEELKWLFGPNHLQQIRFDIMIGLEDYILLGQHRHFLQVAIEFLGGASAAGEPGEQTQPEEWAGRFARALRSTARGAFVEERKQCSLNPRGFFATGCKRPGKEQPVITRQGPERV